MRHQRSCLTAGLFLVLFLCLAFGGSSSFTVNAYADSSTTIRQDLFVAGFMNNQVLRYDGSSGIFLAALDPGNSGSLQAPYGVAFGPDGNIYVSSNYDASVKRYNASTGAFIDNFVPGGSGGLLWGGDLSFGPDGNLYVADDTAPSGAIKRYNGTTGVFIDDFVPGASGGMLAPEGMTFGPDGNLYVHNYTGGVLRFNGTSGAFIDNFAPTAPQGHGIAFGPDGNLYVVDSYTNGVKRFNGTSGAYIDDFVPAHSGGLAEPIFITFGPDGNLYVGDFSGGVKRYNGTSGTYMDDFVPAYSGGLNGALVLRFQPPAKAADPVCSDDGITACFQLNGNALDASGHGNNGTIQGAPTPTTDRFVSANSAYYFNGVNDYITVPPNPTMWGQNFTVSVWASLPAYSPVGWGVYSTILETWDHQGTGNGITLWQATASNGTVGVCFQMKINAIGGPDACLTITDPAQAASFLNRWHHFAATYDGNNFLGFIDGQQIGGGSFPGSFAAPQSELWIGNGPCNSGKECAGYSPGVFKGSIDELKIYNRAISTAEIQKIYKYPPQFAYVTNSNSCDVSVIDATTNSVVKTIPLPLNPCGIPQVVVAPNGKFAYVSAYNYPNLDVNDVFVIDTQTNSITQTISLPAGSASRVRAVSPDGSKVYVANGNSGTISVISTATNTVVSTIQTPTDPIDIAITPDGKFAYVPEASAEAPAQAPADIAVINTETGEVVATIPTPSTPIGVAITPDGSTVYSQISYAWEIAVISTATNTIVSTIPISPGDFPYGLALTPDGKYLYIPASSWSTQSYFEVVDTATNQVVATVPFPGGVGADGAGAEGSAVTKDGAFVYINNDVANTVSVIDSATNTIVTTIPVGQNPVSIAIATVLPVSTSLTSTTTTLTSSVPTSIFGQAVTFTAVISATSGTPTGNVIFKDGDNTIGNGTVNASGQAAFTTQTLAVGQHSITAQYAGDSNFGSSASAPLTQVVATGAIVSLTNSQGVGIAGAVVKYYSGGWQSFGTTGADGKASRQIAAGTYSFRVTYAGANNDKSQNIGTTPLVAFQTVNVFVQLEDSTGAALDTGTVQYYGGGWSPIGSTSGGQVSKELLPGAYSFRMTYAGVSNDKSQNIGTSPVVVFQTVNASIQLKDSTGAALDTGTVQYYGGGWLPIGPTSGGQVSKELLPGAYSFRMTYAGGSNDKSQNIGTSPVVVFQTVNASIQLKDSTGAALDTGTVQYYGGGWLPIGPTSGGQASKELLPGTYSFRMAYAGVSNDKSQNIGTSPVVVFQTVNASIQLKDSTGAALDTGTVQYYGGGWLPIGPTSSGQVSKELLPGTYSFRMAYAGVSNDKSQNIATNSAVVFQTGKVVSASNSCTSYYAGGWLTFTNGMQLLPATYPFRFAGYPQTSYQVVAGATSNIH
jgi:YVTN family beta-propeller protein